jgi:hypothetical protein
MGRLVLAGQNHPDVAGTVLQNAVSKRALEIAHLRETHTLAVDHPTAELQVFDRCPFGFEFVSHFHAIKIDQ